MNSFIFGKINLINEPKIVHLGVVVITKDGLIFKVIKNTFKIEIKSLKISIFLDIFTLCKLIFLGRLILFSKLVIKLI